MPPQPKPPSQRRRRNAGQAQWRELPAEGRQGNPPELPGTDWQASTREWWARIWSSPMAVAWEEADVDSLLRLATLRDQFVQGDLPVSALGAMQTLEDRFGLSPKARRALQWEISRAEVTPAKRESDTRRLRAV